ncbi:uncharacterized protein A4U43_C06F4770 [Asparagus officinalis]|uniref:Protein kinase domain-containing protein n=1 Tax=Asparagus officinalis TaxID=4686 RepID=A0A5P1EJP1_ASPOF|nr:uncharacterized protein A4U43_C06F4770 [Asparagus officinalis]
METAVSPNNNENDIPEGYEMLVHSSSPACRNHQSRRSSALVVEGCRVKAFMLVSELVKVAYGTFKSTNDKEDKKKDNLESKPNNPASSPVNLDYALSLFTQIATNIHSNRDNAMVVILYPPLCNDREPRGPARTGAPKKPLPIEIPAILLAELNKLTGNFGQKALIGEGSYGRVFHAKLSTGEEAAIKKLDPQDSDADFETQLSTVSRLKNEKERCTGAEPGPNLSWNQRVKIAYGAARGIEYLHEKVQPPIVRRDVRSSNVLLFDDYESKLADFTLSKQSPDSAARLHSTRVLVGTFGYHAPELSEDKVKQCIDPKLNNDYPPKAVAKDDEVLQSKKTNLALIFDIYDEPMTLG